MVFFEIWGNDAEMDFRVRFAEVCPFRGLVEVMHDALCAGEGTVYYVYMVDFWAAEEEGKADVPAGLGAGAEDRDAVDAVAAVEDYR